ncbi:Fe3+-hydroxamate ABC transporter substrate-binding protein [Anopheles sinensis]|uniref:Fe3+-hydroxamate ABC transporter substrate-binding protein n=1 Tax=Anopheles sinensis TaxID=74873 RepID=A0A084W5Z6_ANOSI|nr:Fe3+-hydroxamate ABC transporter substrate-binding protein [Anopheles sinensis]
MPSTVRRLRKRPARDCASPITANLCLRVAFRPQLFESFLDAVRILTGCGSSSDGSQEPRRSSIIPGPSRGRATNEQRRAS